MCSLDESFGAVVRRCRKQHGLSQETLGFRSSVHRTYISEIERGLKTPSLRTISKLAEALGITASDLVRMAETYKFCSDPLDT